MAPTAVDVAVCEWNYCNFNVKCELELTVYRCHRGFSLRPYIPGQHCIIHSQPPVERHNDMLRKLFEFCSCNPSYMLHCFGEVTFRKSSSVLLKVVKKYENLLEWQVSCLFDSVQHFGWNYISKEMFQLNRTFVNVEFLVNQNLYWFVWCISKILYTPFFHLYIYIYIFAKKDQEIQGKYPVPWSQLCAGYLLDDS